MPEKKKNYLRFLISQICTYHWEKYPIFHEMGFGGEGVFVCVGGWGGGGGGGGGGGSGEREGLGLGEWGGLLVWGWGRWAQEAGI